ncbi:carboxypeptidase-like regulatory domain-containing protein [Hymenobacter saemangeumensis]
MQPTKNGRLCGQCDKEIYDFSAMSWAAIAQTQAQHGNALCGMYTPAQLAHWGQSPPPGACAKLAAATTLALGLSAIQAPAQTAAVTTAGLKLSGTVMTTSAKGKPEPLPFASVYLLATNQGVLTDEKGHYELSIPADLNSNDSTFVVFISLGFSKVQWAIPRQSQGQLEHDAFLTIDHSFVGFSIRKPTLMEQVKWSLKRWFGRKEE